MKFKSAFLLAAIACIAFSGPAPAAQVSVGRVSVDELEKACKAVGGAFWSDLNGYSCIKANCDGKGGNCIVFCSLKGGACEGRVPKTVKAPAGSGMRGVLNPNISTMQ